MTKEQVKESLEGKLIRYFGVGPDEATPEQMYKAVVYSVKDILQQNKQLKEENDALRAEVSERVDELRRCRNDIAAQIAFTSAVKKDMRRLEVQLNSLKTENASFKKKFSMIENTFAGKIALKAYRWLREMKRRRG